MLYIVYIYSDSSHTWNGCSISVFNPSVFAAEEPSRKISSLSGQPFGPFCSPEPFPNILSLGPCVWASSKETSVQLLPVLFGHSWAIGVQLIWRKDVQLQRGTRLSILMLVLVSLGQSMILDVCESCLSCSGSSQFCFWTKVAESFEAFIISSYLLYAILSQKRFTIMTYQTNCGLLFSKTLPLPVRASAKHLPFAEAVSQLRCKLCWVWFNLSIYPRVLVLTIHNLNESLASLCLSFIYKLCFFILCF